MKSAANPGEILAGRLKRLAEKIEAVAEKDEAAIRHAREVVALRRAAAAEIYSICADFVRSLNGLLGGPDVTISPATFQPEAFQGGSSNLIQINVRGRLLQVDFECSPELISTEDFRIPYTLQGSVRAFSQALLEKDLIEEQLIFHTVEKGHGRWRFFDARTYRSGEFDVDYLASLMEQLL